MAFQWSNLMPKERRQVQDPRQKFYEASRQRVGAHLVYNAFWLVNTFCLYQMHMRDSLHQVDHGIIVHILRAILRLFWGK